MTMNVAPGMEVDGYRIGERIHSGAMAHIYRVDGRDAGYPVVMKIPRIGTSPSGEELISFETESTILPALSGPHVPRVAAVGDLARLPYLVLEWIEGESLEQRLVRSPLAPDELPAVGAALADALHNLHLQDTIHLDLKPENAILRPDGRIVLVDFGLACHARFPDLLAEERRFAAGSAPYISPEQVLGTRTDPRSDLFALGVVLYELATGELPFGTPRTVAGLRDRLWLDPAPPAGRRAGVPPWLQEIILRCMEPEVEERYQSAAHVAFDLRHPEQVKLTSRAYKRERDPLFRQLARWWRMRRVRLQASRLPRAQVGRAPVIMLALDTQHPDDDRHPALRRAASQILSLSREFRLICVSVIGAGPVAAPPSAPDGQLEHLVRLRHWVEPLKLPAHRLSLHVLESPRPAEALIEFARANHVDLIVLGAPQPSQERLAWWRSVASGVTANAPCSVHVVRVPERADD